MSPEDARSARETLGLTPAQLAMEFLVDERNVIAWERGDIKLPRRLGRELTWRAAVARQQRALAESGLPDCEWVKQWEDTPLSSIGGKFKQHLAKLEQHAPACPVCRAREDYVRARLPPLPPPPLPPFAHFLVGFHSRVHKLPPWARPAAYGAALVGAVGVLRSFLAMIAQGFQLHLLLIALGAILVGAYGGAVGGIAYQLARGPTRRIPQVGDYLLGTVIVSAYFLTVLVPVDLISDAPMLRSRGAWINALLFVLLLGILLGQVLRSRKAS